MTSWAGCSSGPFAFSRRACARMCHCSSSVCAHMIARNYDSSSRCFFLIPAQQQWVHGPKTDKLSVANLRSWTRDLCLTFTQIFFYEFWYEIQYRFQLENWYRIKHERYWKKWNHDVRLVSDLCILLGMNCGMEFSKDSSLQFGIVLCMKVGRNLESWRETLVWPLYIYWFEIQCRFQLETGNTSLYMRVGTSMDLWCQTCIWPLYIMTSYETDFKVGMKLIHIQCEAWYRIFAWKLVQDLDFGLWTSVWTLNVSHSNGALSSDSWARRLRSDFHG